MRTNWRVLFAILVGFFAASQYAHAQTKTVEYQRMEACAPFSVDGSQVFEGVWYEGKCFGNPKVTLRVTDFKLGLMCSVQALSCVAVSVMDAEQRAHYDRLRSTTPIKDPKLCVQRDGTWQREMLTSAAAPCTVALNGARTYDFVLRKGCVILGNLVLGCTDLTEEQLAEAHRTGVAHR